MQKNLNSDASAEGLSHIFMSFTLLKIIETAKGHFIMWVIFINVYHIRNKTDLHFYLITF